MGRGKSKNDAIVDCGNGALYRTQMRTVLASRSISISDLKKNPAKALREAGAQPLSEEAGEMID